MGEGSKEKVMKYGEGPRESVVHGPWTSLLRHCDHSTRKYASLGTRLLWKYIRNYFVVYQLTSHFLLYLLKLQRIWSWNFGFANRKIWAFIWYQKMYYFRWSLGGWECDGHRSAVEKKANLMAHNWQKWKSGFLICPCLKIYRVEAVGTSIANYA